MRASWILFLAGRGSCKKTTFLFPTKTSVIVLLSFLLLVAKSITQISRRITLITIQEILRKFHSSKIWHHALVTNFNWWLLWVIKQASYLEHKWHLSPCILQGMFSHIPRYQLASSTNMRCNLLATAPQLRCFCNLTVKANYCRIIIAAVKKQRLSRGFVPY